MSQAPAVRRLCRLALPLVSLTCSTSWAQTAPPATTEAGIDRVVVSARKREEALIEVPEAISTISEAALRDYHLASFIDLSYKIPNLSFAYGYGGTAGNPGTAFGDARTIAIRGISGARTTGFYIDDTPLPGAVDVRVLDLKSVEILKGPQGTLYGESSLGGNVRYITKAPNLNRGEWRFMVEAGRGTGSAGNNSAAEAAGNIVLSPGTAALRVATYIDDTAGYLKRSYPSDINHPDSPRVIVDNQGAERNKALSLIALLRVTSDFDISLRWLYQNQYYNGFPASYAPLPAFEAQRVVEHTTNVQPDVRDIWTLPAIGLLYKGKGWTLSSSTSRFDRHVRDIEDTTEGTAAYWGTTLPQSFAWHGLHGTRELAHETRVTFDEVQHLSGTVGLFYSYVNNHFEIPAIYGQLGTVPGKPSLLWIQNDVNTQQNIAVFGELYYRFLERFTLTAGLRKYWLKETDHLGFDYLDVVFRSATDNASNGISPKLALAYQASPNSLLYANAGKGFRQGNAQFEPAGFGCDSSLAAIGQTPQSVTKIAPDSLWSYELGGKFDFPDPGLLLTASAFHIDWKNIQQPIFLNSCAFYIQGNAGAAAIDGGEIELAGRVSSALKLRVSAGYENARITRDGNTGQAAGTPVYQVPKWTFSAGGVSTHQLSDRLQLHLAADYSYTGSSVSSNSGAGLNLVRAGYHLVDARAGLAWGNAELTLGVRNLGNANPNLGDLGYIGYQRYVPGTSTPLPQVATLPPRTWTLQYRNAF